MLNENTTQTLSHDAVETLTEGSKIRNMGQDASIICAATESGLHFFVKNAVAGFHRSDWPMPSVELPRCGSGKSK